MDVVAVVVVGAGRFDVLEPVAGVPLLVRAVEGLLSAGGFERVHVLLDQAVERTRANDACADLPVVLHPHALQRDNSTQGNAAGTLRIILRGSDAVVVHDAARALAPSGLVRAVLDGLHAGHSAVVPTLPLTDTVKEIDAVGLLGATPDRAGLRVVQTPQGYRSSVIEDFVETDPLRLAQSLATSGVVVHTVAGDPMAFAVRSPWDARLAAVLRQGEVEA